jgi:hypothetical protein
VKNIDVFYYYFINDSLIRRFNLLELGFFKIIIIIIINLNLLPVIGLPCRRPFASEGFALLIVGNIR